MANYTSSSIQLNVSGWPPTLKKTAALDEF